MLLSDHLRQSRAMRGLEHMSAGEIQLLIQSEMSFPEEGEAALAQQERIRAMQYIREQKLRSCLKK